MTNEKQLVALLEKDWKELLEEMSVGIERVFITYKSNNSPNNDLYLVELHNFKGATDKAMFYKEDGNPYISFDENDIDDMYTSAHFRAGELNGKITVLNNYKGD